MSFLKGLKPDAIKENIGALAKSAQEGISNIKVDEIVKGAQEGLSNIKVNEIVKSAQEGLSNIKVDELVKGAQESISNIKVDEIVKGAADAAASGAAKIGEAVEHVTQRGSTEPEVPSFKELVALLWCLAYADAAITDSERKMLGSISTNLDENYADYADEIEQNYLVKLETNSKEFGAANAAKIEAQRIVESLDLSPQESKLLCWNLLALANSDYLDERELDFIRFVSEKLGVDTAVFEELRNYSDALVDVSKGLDQLKSSGKSYDKIEPLVSEYEKREAAITTAAYSLIEDK